MIELAAPPAPEVGIAPLAVSTANNIPVLPPNSPRAFQVAAGGNLNGNLVVTGTTSAFGYSSTVAGYGVYVAPSLVAGSGYSIGLFTNPTIGSDATTWGSALYAHVNTVAASYTLGTVFTAAIGSPTIGAGSSVTSLYGLYIYNQGAAGITNAYGLYLNVVSGASSTNTAFFNAGTSQQQGVFSLGWQGPQPNIALNVVFNFAAGIGGTQYGAKFVQGMASDAGGGIGLYFQPTGGGASTTYATVQALVLDSPNYNSSTHITNAYGLYVANQVRAVTTNAHGIFIEPQSGASGINRLIGLGNTNNYIRNAPNDVQMVSVEAGSFAQFAGQSGALMGANLYWDGQGWYRYNTGNPGMLLEVSQAGTLNLYTTPAAANPATVTNQFQIDMAGLIQINNRIKLLSDTGWLIPTFLNGWSGYSAPFDCCYRKMPDGNVIVRGLVTGGNLNMGGSYAYFTLPAGFRPGKQMLFCCMNSGAVMRIDVDTAGNVFAQETRTGTYANGWQSLDGVRFLAEN